MSVIKKLDLLNRNGAYIIIPTNIFSVVDYGLGETSFMKGYTIHIDSIGEGCNGADCPKK